MLSSDVISRIIRFGASGLPIVSLYVTVSAADAPSAVRTRMGSLLDQIRPITEDDLNRDARVVAEAFENAASTGLGAIGIDDSLWAGSRAAIERCSSKKGLPSQASFAMSPDGSRAAAYTAHCAAFPPDTPMTSSTNWPRQ